MLGKDYMLAIILVNCDGVHGGPDGREHREGTRERDGLPQGSKAGRGGNFPG